MEAPQFEGEGKTNKDTGNMFFCTDSLAAIANARDKLKEAEKLKCSCSGFTLQYEGSCQCTKGKKVDFAKAELQNLIDNI